MGAGHTESMKYTQGEVGKRMARGKTLIGMGTYEADKVSPRGKQIRNGRGESRRAAVNALESSW